MLLIYLIKLLLTNPVGFLIAIAVLIMPLLISITIHEWSHGFAAYKFGDPTPKIQGRLSLNPFAHLDPVGTLMLLVVGVGWAKPVEINPANINGRTKQMLVALAGPLSNVILAISFSIIAYSIFRFSGTSDNSESSIMYIFMSIFHMVIQINIVLALFNMLPIPPLDGSNILKWLLPENLGNLYYSKLAPYGMFILLLILFTVGFKFVFNTANMIEMYIFNILEYIFNLFLSFIPVVN